MVRHTKRFEKIAVTALVILLSVSLLGACSLIFAKEATPSLVPARSTTPAPPSLDDHPVWSIYGTDRTIADVAPSSFRARCSYNLNDGLLLVGGSSGLIFSYDGTYWEKVSAPLDTRDTVVDILYVDGHFYFVCTFSGIVSCDIHLRNFEVVCDTQNLWAIAYGDNQFIAVGSSIALYSNDLETWSILDSSDYYDDVLFAEGKFILANRSRGTLYYLTDTLDLMPIDRPSSYPFVQIRDMYYSNGFVYMASASGEIYKTSIYDLSGWQLLLSANSGYTCFEKILFYEDRFFAVGYNSENKGVIYSSDNCVLWTSVGDIEFEKLWIVCYFEDYVIAFGENASSYFYKYN